MNNIIDLEALANKKPQQEILVKAFTSSDGSECQISRFPETNMLGIKVISEQNGVEQVLMSDEMFYQLTKCILES